MSFNQRYYQQKLYEARQHEMSAYYRFKDAVKRNDVHETKKLVADYLYICYQAYQEVCQDVLDRNLIGMVEPLFSPEVMQTVRGRMFCDQMFDQAIRKQQFDMVSQLIAAKAHVAGCFLETLWMHAQTARQLVHANADVNAGLPCGRSALHCAVSQSLPNAVVHLVQLKADPNNMLGKRSCLNEALGRRNSYQLVDALLRCKASVNQGYGGPTLDFAIDFAQPHKYNHGSKQIVQLLIDAKADLSSLYPESLARMPTMTDRPDDMLVAKINQLVLDTCDQV